MLKLLEGLGKTANINAVCSGDSLWRGRKRRRKSGSRWRLTTNKETNRTKPSWTVVSRRSECLTIAILPTGYMSHAILSWIVVTHFRCEMRWDRWYLKTCRLWCGENKFKLPNLPIFYLCVKIVQVRVSYFTRVETLLFKHKYFAF
jgi:hypothetical protein